MHWESHRLSIFGQVIMLPLFAWTLQSRCVEQCAKWYPHCGRRDKRDKGLLSLRPEPDILQPGVPTATSMCHPSLQTTLRQTFSRLFCYNTCCVFNCRQGRLPKKLLLLSPTCGAQHGMVMLCPDWLHPASGASPPEHEKFTAAL